MVRPGGEEWSDTDGGDRARDSEQTDGGADLSCGWHEVRFLHESWRVSDPTRGGWAPDVRHADTTSDRRWA